MKMLQSIHSEASPEFLLKQSLAIEYKSIELWRSAIPKGSACHLDGYDKVKWAADLVHDKDMNSDSSHIKRNNELRDHLLISRLIIPIATILLTVRVI